VTGLRRLLALGLLASGALIELTVGRSTASYAEPPDVVAWWSVTNIGVALPAVPPVPAGDLLVQGSNAVPVKSPLGHAPIGAQAVAGLSFPLRPTDYVGPLTLTIDGSAPSHVSITACRATSRFTSAHGGSWSKVPSYDAKNCVAGKLTGSRLTFSDTTSLAANGRLAVVFIPGPLDRVVFRAPGAEALVVHHGIGVGSEAPPLGSGVTSPAPQQTTRHHRPVAVPPADGGSAGFVPLLPRGGAPTSPPPSAQAPSLAGPSAARQATGAQPSVQLATRTRRTVALGVVGIELAGFLLLARPSRRDPETAALAGVGSYRSERQGQPPRL
jgi:hypothetical protein